MPHVNFVHLHNHTQYSLLDGGCKVDDFLDRAVELKFPAIAITDHGNMFGVIDFYKKAMAKGIKPIIGMEAYVAYGSRFDKSTHGIKEAAFHLVLLARNEQGYRNLIKLSSAGFLEGFYYKPRVDRDILKQYGDNLIALSACIKGEVAHYIVNDDIDRARQCVRDYQDIFGKENFYLELQDHGLEEQKRVNKVLFELSEEMGAPLVVTNDIHYIGEKDALAHEVLLCIQTGTTVQDENRMKFSSDEFYMKSYDEMKKLFPDNPEVMENSVEIANRCNVEFDFSVTHLPPFEPPEGKTQEQYLREVCEEGLKSKLGTIPDNYLKQMEFEIKVIESMGYTSYFLIVWDFIKYAKDNKIFVGPGRGSAAGSVVSYGLNITEVDPIKFGLLFERFLNPDRVSMPDIDIDFCYERRNEVIEYVAQKYGSENVAQIITFGTMAARMTIRDVGRALGMAYQEVDFIAKLIPAGPNVTIVKALKQEPRLGELMKKEPKIKKLMTIAQALEGLMRHASTHAAGVVISDRPLTDYVPLFKTGDQVITQYSMKILEQIGLLKMDFLGLKTLTVIGNAVTIIKKTRGVDIDIATIPLDNPNTYELLQKGETFGIFQLESSGMRDLIRKLKPDNIEEIADLLALFRPGPLGSGMVDDFIKRKHSAGTIKYEHPLLEPILKETHGVILYQEQVMRIARDLAGFSLAQADNMRRAMGKKIPEVLEEQKKEFIEGAISKGVSRTVAEKVFNLIVYFAGYGFNKSHSVAYSFISYQTAYLKANYPLEFMTAILTSERDNTDKIVQYIDESSRLGIKVLPPSVNESFSAFTAVEGSIRFGLSAIKNVGTTAIQSIISSRKREGKFVSIFHFIENVELRLVNRKVIESLIKSGACDCFEMKRSQMMAMIDKLLEYGNDIQKDRNAGQFSLFEGENEEDRYAHLLRDIPDIEEWPESQLLEFEKETLGFYVSSHPLVRHAKLINIYTSANSANLDGLRDQQEALLGGIITAIRTINTKRGDLMAFVTLEDLKGKVEIIFFPDIYQKDREHVQVGKILFVRGKVDARSDMPKLLASEVITLDNVREKLTKVFSVTVSTTGLSQDVLTNLKKILKSHSGQVPVKINFIDAAGRKTQLSPSPDYFINADDHLFYEVEELLGENAIKVLI
ncbi:MAG: DNA polymerase III subunit alpha [Candidatus Omnitrophica bacterium]|nr:DNA polymerase III subunit alpha [Candidatus Omnitrophota bacterium]